MNELPVYNDGRFDVYRIRTDESKDFPEEYLKNENMQIWFNEISVYDKLRYELSQSDIEITMKVRIPQFKKIDSKCICVIEGVQHSVYNAAHITNKNGFRETELTLVRPQKKYEVRYD